ncbi:Cyclic di-GMP phosphodiesterase response regulator RpfG [Phycisphaerae bacterium RAS2]|nr:Cyclic di-GMP phosphodiesterase response regulator RpfG [Phycisphaerae bacterium RAS2]
MQTESGPLHSPEHIGRLPTPVVEHPLAAERFRELCNAWQAVGIPLWQFDAEGRCTDHPEHPSGFWKHLMGAPESMLRLSHAARDRLTPTQHPFEPFPGVVQVIHAPVRLSRKVIGVVIGLARCDGSDEAFARACQQVQLDQQALRHLAQDIPSRDATAVKHFAHLLRTEVSRICELDEQRTAIQSLTGNLESTYEELNLVYHISEAMALPQNPILLLGRVGPQILEVSRAASLAFVLTPQDLRPGAPAAPSEDRIVRVGRRNPPDDVLDRLAELAGGESARAAGHVLLNNVENRDEVQFARGHAEHVVAMPLRQGGRLLGAMMAIDCRDGGDFTSIDVQLLRAVADRIASFLENQRLYDDLADLFMGMLHSLVNSVDAKDPYTCGHSERVAYISRCLAQAAGLSAYTCDRIYLAGLLHDVGKIGVPDAILTKPGKLTDEEFTVLKRHPQIGAHIVEHVRQIHDLIPGVLHHHERMDGRGYPGGLAGEDIPLLGRIICLADCFDAMTTNRTYRSALPVKAAVAEIRRCAGTQFDPGLAEVFINLDLEDVFVQTRKFAGFDPAFGQSGALKAVTGHLGVSPPRDTAAWARAARPAVERAAPAKPLPRQE